jgi:hypothetical protein
VRQHFAAAAQVDVQAPRDLAQRPQTARGSPGSVGVQLMPAITLGAGYAAGLRWE